MVRFILRHTRADAMCGTHSTGLYTLTAECPAIEREITRGGFGEYGWETVDVVGAEVALDVPAAREEE